MVPKVVGRVFDPMSGYFLVRRQVIAGPILNPMGYKILIEVLGRGNIEQIASKSLKLAMSSRNGKRARVRSHRSNMRSICSTCCGCARGGALVGSGNACAFRLAGLILNVLLLNVLFKLLGINRYLANLIAIAAVTIWNFWLNLKLNWRVTQMK